MTWPTQAATDLLSALARGIDQVLDEAAALRRDLHAHPHLGGFEGPTAQRLRDALGLPVTKVAGTGFLTRLGPAGPSVGIRAELDGLPVAEETGVAWAATNGAMHACGHDVHMAATWALLTAASRIALPVGMVGVFQPREEVQPSGAKDILDSGLMAAEQIRGMIAAHVQPRVSVGVISTGVGGINAAADEFDIVVRGHAGHGAYPQVTIDPVPVLASIALGLHELVGRTIDPTHPAVLTIGRIQAGTTHNIIPEYGSLHGIVRTMHETDRRHLHADLRRLAEHTAAARGATAEVSILVGDPVLANAADLVRAVDPLLDGLGITVAEEPFRSCGADDFSHYSAACQILMMFVGTGEETGGRHEIGLHHPRYLPGDETLRQVALALAAGYVAGARVAGGLA
ncbi:MAG: amidohydrolase [Micropruina sp.]|nr:amidohydrolase [Micropruina sp.]